ncbi:MAG: hypothetical protein ABR964_12800 [Tepidisphaeraceae bacterium]|jgi:hypothetical protein
MTGRPNTVAYALYANAAILLAILVALLARGSGTAPALAQGLQAPIAGGGGVYVMPCQFHPNVWGCFLLDTEHQTLCTYEYRSGEKALVLTAARHFRYDLQLKNYDTFPAWYDIKKLVQDQENADRATASPSTQPAPEDARQP